MQHGQHNRNHRRGNRHSTRQNHHDSAHHRTKVTRPAPRESRPGLPDWRTVSGTVGPDGVLRYTVSEMVSLSRSPLSHKLPSAIEGTTIPSFERIQVVLNSREYAKRTEAQNSNPEWDMDFSQELDIFGAASNSSKSADFAKQRHDFEMERRRRRQNRGSSEHPSAPVSTAPNRSKSNNSGKQKMPAALQQLFANATAINSTSAVSTAGSGEAISLAEIESQMLGTGGESNVQSQPPGLTLAQIEAQMQIVGSGAVQTVKQADRDNNHEVRQGGIHSTQPWQQQQQQQHYFAMHSMGYPMQHVAHPAQTMQDMPQQPTQENLQQQQQQYIHQMQQMQQMQQRQALHMQQQQQHRQQFSQQFHGVPAWGQIPGIPVMQGVPTQNLDFTAAADRESASSRALE